jgi:hypothetical protein
MQIRARKLLVLRQIIVGTVMQAFDLIKSPGWEIVLYVPGVLGIEHDVVVLLPAKLGCVDAQTS